MEILIESKFHVNLHVIWSQRVNARHNLLATLWFLDVGYQKIVLKEGYEFNILLRVILLTIATVARKKIGLLFGKKKDGAALSATTNW